MHSAVGLGPKADKLPNHILRPSDTVLQQWAPVECVIADEVSMVGLSLFGLWEESLGYVKDNRASPCGGLIPVLVLDHCQLRPVMALPLYATKRRKGPLIALHKRGRKLYEVISKVIYLDENMRFSDDPEWGEWLAGAGLGTWSQGLRAHIAKLPDFDIEHRHYPRGLIQTISTDNLTRGSINDTALPISVTAIGPQRIVYVIPPKLSRQVSLTEVTKLRGLFDNQTGNIPVFLHLYIGMPVRIKANQCVPRGVVNGAMGAIYHIDWPEGTSFSLQPNGTWLASDQPNTIYVDLFNRPPMQRIDILPQTWPPSVMPVRQVTASIDAPPVSIKGFPLVPAFGTTVHGVQGETRSAVAITNIRPDKMNNVDKHALYVALSRLRTRHGLHWIGQKPADIDYSYFSPLPEVLAEDS